MKRILCAGTAEITEKKSRFIADVFNVEGEEAAQAYLNETKKKYWDARHHCYAYVCGDGSEIRRFSDDGEPSGTAGKPILEVITGSETENCLIVVSRYFGGTLLGTGGLIRAYQAAARQGLENCRTAEAFDGVFAEFVVDYEKLGKLQYLCAQSEAVITDIVYRERVCVQTVTAKQNYAQFCSKITDAFQGSVVPESEEKRRCGIEKGKNRVIFF